jgi:hypothetical protein
VQDALVVVAVAAAVIAAFVGMAVLTSMWRSTSIEIFARLFPGASHEISKIMRSGAIHAERDEGSHRRGVGDEASDAVQPPPGHPSHGETRITLRRVLWGVNATDRHQ